MKSFLIILLLLINSPSFSQDKWTAYTDPRRNLVYTSLLKQSLFSLQYERVCPFNRYSSINPHIAIGHIPGDAENNEPSNDMLFTGTYFLLGGKNFTMIYGGDIASCFYGRNTYFNFNGNFGIRYQNRGDDAFMIDLTYNPILLSTIDAKKIFDFPYGFSVGFLF